MIDYPCSNTGWKTSTTLHFYCVHLKRNTERKAVCILQPRMHVAHSQQIPVQGIIFQHRYVLSTFSSMNPIPQIKPWFPYQVLGRPPSPQHQGFAWLPAPLPQPPQEAERTVMPPWLPWGPLKSCDEARERARASVLQVSTLQFNCFLPNAGCKVFGFFYRHRTEKKRSQ